MIRILDLIEKDDDPLSPTVAKVLDEYLTSLHADDGIRNKAADRLNTLLRKGKVPKTEDIDAALFPSKEGEES